MATTPDNGERRPRRALPIILIVLATVIGIVSVFALWAKRQLLETETWTTTSEQLIQDADIQSALNTFIVTAIFDNVDVEARLADRLPPQLAPLAGPISGAVRSGADDLVAKALSEPKVQQLFVDASAAAQSKLIALIDDEGEFVSTTGGVVTLDLTSVVASVTAELGLPDVAAKLPPEASSIEIMKSSELDAAQKGLNLLQKAGYVLTALVLLLYAAAIALAGARRRETLRAVGFSFIFVGIVVLFARGAAGNLVVGSLSEVASSDAAVSSTYHDRHLADPRDGPVDRPLRDRARARRLARRPDRCGDLDPPRAHPLSAPAGLRLRRARHAVAVAVLVGPRDRYAQAGPLAAVGHPRGARDRDASTPGDPGVPGSRHDRVTCGDRPRDRRADARVARAACLGTSRCRPWGREGRRAREAGRACSESGVLTDEELAAEKKRILSGT